MLICSDHPEATETTSEIVRKIPDCARSTPASCRTPPPIEAFTAVLLQLNVRYKTRVAVKFTGINED